MLLHNAKKVISQKLFIIYFLLGATFIVAPTYYFLDIELVRGNIGIWFVYVEIILTIISAALFGFFIASMMYKITCFSPKRGAEGILGGFFVTLVSGCPSCSITLAYYVGAAGFISTLPYHGLELKTLGILIICYAIYDQLKYLEICKIKKSKKTA